MQERFPDAFIPRPGLIVGPWDPTGRFTYWPQRIADRRPRARARAAGRRRAGDRRARPRRVDRRAPPRTRLAGHLQRGRSADDPRDAVRDLPPRRGQRRRARVGRRASSSPSTRSASGWSCRCGCTIRSTPRCSRSTRRPRSPPASRRGRSRRRSRDARVDRGGEAPADPPAGLEREKERAVLEAWAAGRALR